MAAKVEEEEGRHFFQCLYLAFGHYISDVNNDHISDFHALKTSLALALVYSIALNQWSRGLCVIEKVMGVNLINILWAILLMEVDFNAANKIIYGEHLLDNVCEYKLMPEEIFSVKNYMADNGALLKTLFYDIVQLLQ
jgi:hypothetical protein